MKLFKLMVLALLISKVCFAVDYPELNEKGVEVDLGFTNIYQSNVKNGLSTHDENGRYTGSYDLEVNADLYQLLGIESFRMYMLIEGSWPDEEGINENSVGSFFGVNDDAAGNRSIDVTELWFEKSNADNTLRFRAGKLDLTAGFDFHNYPVAFDTTVYSNDETSQFLNSALVNNPLIPFPDNGLGAGIFMEPYKNWYVSAAVQDAQADARETGFNTALHDKDYFFYIMETGFLSESYTDNGPVPGAFRFGMWYDPQPKERFTSGSIKRDDLGFYTACDKMVYKENANKGDNQGLGIFARAGYADRDVSELSTFWSFGLSYKGLLENRNEDVIGLGYAQGVFSDKNTAFAEDYESVTEVYYNYKVKESIHLTPSLQYIQNPGGTGDAADATLIALRLQMGL